MSNELSYAVGWSLLKKLLFSGVITRFEFEYTHALLQRKYSPAAVRRLP